jgi:hypothetical protein
MDTSEIDVDAMERDAHPVPTYAPQYVTLVDTLGDGRIPTLTGSFYKASPRMQAAIAKHTHRIETAMAGGLTRVRGMHSFWTVTYGTGRLNQILHDFHMRVGDKNTRVWYHGKEGDEVTRLCMLLYRL